MMTGVHIHRRIYKDVNNITVIIIIIITCAATPSAFHRLRTDRVGIRKRSNQKYEKESRDSILRVLLTIVRFVKLCIYIV
jgi:hypothetical protein